MIRYKGRRRRWQKNRYKDEQSFESLNKLDGDYIYWDEPFTMNIYRQLGFGELKWLDAFLI